MLFTSSSADAALLGWELVEYLACAAVLLGVLGEYLADFTNFRNVKEDAHRRDTLSKASTLVLIAGLAVELFALVQTNRISGERIASLNVEAKNANSEAAKANERSVVEETARLRLELALIPHFLSAKDQKEIADVCRPFATSGITVEVRATLGTGIALGAQISDALRGAGFATTLRASREALFDVTTAGPIEAAGALNAITKALTTALGKKLSITASGRILPAGSPVLITVGEQPIWSLPR
jgi:hypothetical protein